MARFSLSAISPTIISERLKGYKWILAGQLVVMITFLFLFELFVRYPFQNWQQVIVVFLGAVLLIMNYFSYELIKDLTDIKFFQRLVLILLCLAVLSSIIASLNAFGGNTLFYRYVMVGSLMASILSFIILLYFMLKDIFSEKHDVTYRLWGSASIYLLIGSVFGLTYSLLETILPNEFNINTPMDIFHVIPCYNFSYYTLAGIDSPFTDFSLLVKNISVMESIFSNLYIVLVVGRLLSK